jgi:WD40 repeat protein
LAWSHRGLLAITGDAGTVQLWSLQGRPRLLRALRGLGSVNKQPEVIASIAFSSDGSLVAAGDVNHMPTSVKYRFGTVAVWDSSSGRLLWKHRSKSGTVNALSFAPDGAVLAAGYEDGTVVLYDARTGKVRRTLTLQGGGKFSFETLTFAPTGLLATGTWAGIVQLWNPTNGREVGRPTLVAAAPVASISFDSTGDTFATTGGSDGLAKLWRTSTLQQFGATFPGDPGSWGTARFTGGGSQLVVAYDDDPGKVWPTSVGAWKRHACSVAGRSFTREEWRRFVGDRPYASTC